MIRALLVDDEPPARQRLRQLLGEAGDVQIVGEAAHAEEARAVIDAIHPDVVFLDIEMPEVHGTTFAASLAEPRPYIVFATAYEHYAIEAFALDATDYLVKPVSRARLAATLDRVRARLGQRSEAERDIRSASRVQASFMPRTLPAPIGFDCAAATVQARGVGGDFYDAFARGPGVTAYVLGDVAGKGVPAGLVASSVQARVQTAARHQESAAALVARVNDDAIGTADTTRRLEGPESLQLSQVSPGPSGRLAARRRGKQILPLARRSLASFATLIYAELHVADASLHVVNAGHPAPLVLDRFGSAIHRLDATGPVVGLLSKAVFDQHRLVLDPGATLVAVSDGVLEAFDPSGEEFGEQRLVDLIRAATDDSALALRDRIFDAVKMHRGAAAVHDDVTVLVIKRAFAAELARGAGGGVE